MDAKLLLFGDFLPADRQHTIGIGIGSTASCMIQKPWVQKIRELKTDKSLLFGNLEAPFPGSMNAKSKKKEFAGNDLFASILKQMGVDIVSVANNHILEHGEQGFQNTLHVLDHYGIQYVGVANEETASNLIIQKVGDLRVGFAAMNGIHDILPNHSYAELTESAMYLAIKGLQTLGADVICLSVHWGNEYIHIPSWNQIHMARGAIDAGAHLIIGHHPHVVQPVEMYGNGLIIYSLGNFLFDMLWSNQVRRGMVIECTVRSGRVKSFTIKAVNIQHDYTPQLLDEDPWLTKVLKKNYERMNELLEQGERKYHRYYDKKRKRNRTFARLGMKKQLIQQWSQLPSTVRSTIISNLFS